VALGTGEPETLQSVYNLGDNLKKQGKHDEAVDLFERELQGCAALHGTEHKETKVSASGLAAYFGELGRTKRAEQLKLQYAL